MAVGKFIAWQKGIAGELREREVHAAGPGGQPRGSDDMTRVGAGRKQ